MFEDAHTRRIHASVYARFEYHTHIEMDVSDKATEEEIQRKLDEAARLAVAGTYNGQQPEITVTQQEVYRYEVEVSTHQMLYQTIEIVSDRPLADEQIAERTVEQAQKGSWEQGAIDQNIDINNVTER